MKIKLDTMNGNRAAEGSERKIYIREGEKRQKTLKNILDRTFELGDKTLTIKIEVSSLSSRLLFLKSESIIIIILVIIKINPAMQLRK